MDQCKSANTLMSATLSLDQDINGKSVDKKSYRGMIGLRCMVPQLWGFWFDWFFKCGLC